MKPTNNRLLQSFCDLPISRKLLAITILSSLVTLMVLCSFSFVREWRSFSERKISQLDTIARILASNTVASLRFDDPYAAKEYVDSLQHETDIESATIFNNEGQVFAYYSKSKSAAPDVIPVFEGETWQGNRLFFAKKVTLNKQAIGTILIEMDTASLRSAVWESLWTAVALLLGGLAATTWLTIRMQRLITQPIKELAEVAEAVSERNDYSIRATKRNQDEVGSLVDSVNSMLEKISEHDATLRNINSNLEHTVAVRTEDLRNRNDALLNAMEAAKAASVAKGEFLATMSHELRTPMNSIIGMASLLKESKLDDESKDFVDTINISSDTLLSLINDLLDYSKIESGRLELERAQIALLPVLEDSMEIAATRQAEQLPICLLSCDPSLPNDIIGDATRLKQVLINLISNAIKFTERGHVWVKAWREQGDNGAKDRLLFAVHDTGIGIPPEKIPQLFEHFSQVDSSTTRKYGGTGLGLAICKRLINAMGGTIEVKSEIGKGSSFVVSIPIKAIESTESILGDLPTSAADQPRIQLQAVPHPVSQALRQYLAHWNFDLSQYSKNDDSKTINIVSALSDTELKTLEFAKRTVESTGKCAKTIFICWRHHATHLRNQGINTLLTLPFRIKDLRKVLDLEPQTAAIIAADGENDRATSFMRRNTRILLAEDHLLNQKVFVKIMMREGYQVDVANDGEDAVAKLEDNQYDVVFMDLHMPKLDGTRAMKRIRRILPDWQQPWIIAFTANAQTELSKELLEAGMDDFLSKPVRSDELRRAMQTYFEERRARIIT